MVPCVTPLIRRFLQHIPTLLSIKDRLPTLKFIVSMDPLEEEGEAMGRTKRALLGAWGEQKGVKIYSFTEGIVESSACDEQADVSEKLNLLANSTQNLLCLRCRKPQLPSITHLVPLVALKVYC